MLNETIGWIGNIMFAICGIPQVIKTYRTKSARDLSVLFLWLWFAGELFTFYYILHGDFETGQTHYPLYFNYVVNILMAGFLLYAKYVYPSNYLNSTKG